MSELSPAAAHLRALIRCPSVTPEEGGALDYLVSVLEPLGFECHRLRFAEVDNLYARRGSAAPNICFAGHTDVVPPGHEDDWSRPPFEGAIDGADMIGRGAVDMKGAVASFLAAVEEIGPDHAGSISLLVTGDEEGPAENGTVKVLEWLAGRDETIDACILGEPTNPDALGDALKVGRRGSLSGEIVVEGVQGHAAYPHLADNPLRALSPMVSSLMHPPFDEGTERFQPTNLEVTSIDTGNSATNVVPARARALFNVRFNDTWSPETLKEEIVRRVESKAQDDALRPGRDAIAFRIAWRDRPSPVFLTKDESLIAAVSDAVEGELGRRPDLSTGGGTSDARFIKDVAPVVEFGLVGRTMHQIDERVALADLDTLARVYARALRTLLS